MKKSVLLLLVLAALIGVAVWSKNQKEARLSEIARRGVKNRELLVPDLKVNAIKKVMVTDKEHATTLTEGPEGWVVVERNNYPADIDKLSGAIMALREMKIGGKQIIGRGAWADAKVLEPAEGVTEGVGTLVKLTDEKDGEVATLILGGDVSTSGGNNPQFGTPSQRLVRIPADEDSLWMIGSNLNEFQSKPEEWLDKGFISVQKLKTLEVTPVDKAEAWTVSRTSEAESVYSLAGVKEGEELDETKLALNTLLTTASFNDVKTKAEVGDLFKESSKAKITTFDGFTYELEVAKQSQDGADKYFVTVAVKGEFPKERKPGQDEKEEDKARLDEEFKAELTRLTEKLEKEQKLAGWVFEVAEYAVNNLTLNRSSIVKAAEPPDEPEANAAAPAPAGAPAMPAPVPAPAGAPAMPAPAPENETAAKPTATEVPLVIDAKPPGISVTTPPVAVPPVPKDEVKPAPAPDANPAEVDKK
jgi:hypothetical protein